MISVKQYQRERGIISDAMQTVGDHLHGWSDCKEHRPLAEMMQGWSMIALVEAMTRMLLAERGYDEELLDMAFDGELPAGWSLGDLDAELERTRRAGSE